MTGELPALIASRYIPLRLIAKGGMGAVYEVEHTRTGEHLALKVLHAGVGASTETQERFKREARASARIKSEHVVRVTDADVAPELGGAPFLVMELLEGTDLERAALRPGPATVVDWLRQVAGVIDRAHGLRIIHRDLKPENLFLCRREELPPIIKVLDFGIIKMAEEQTAASQAGRILGTPQYMAPEQLSAEGEITGAVDRYALGLVAYRLLTGELWYRGDVMSVLGQILHQPLGTPTERHPELGAAFDVWFARACHREPEKRFASAAEQIEALAETAGLPRATTDIGSAPTLASEPVVVPPAAPRRARAVAVPALLLLAAAIAVVAGARALRRPDAPAARAATPTFAASPAPTAVALPPPVARVEEAKPTTPSPPTDASRNTRRRPGQHHAPTAPAPSSGASAAPDPYADQK